MPERTRLFLTLLGPSKGNQKLELLLELALDCIYEAQYDTAYDYLETRSEGLEAEVDTSLVQGYMGMLKYAEWCQSSKIVEAGDSEFGKE
jgi:hypothetical protein